MTEAVSVKRRRRAVMPFDEWSHKEWRVTEFLAMITAACESIPAEHRNDATATLDGERLTIEYSRPETDEELHARITAAAESLRAQEARERQEYARLQAKFGAVEK